MSILLDTNALIDFAVVPSRLPKSWQAKLMKTDIRIFVSAVSIWEIAIKRALNRADFQIEPLEILKECNNNGYIMLDITPELAAKVGGLPLHHHDPFDRLLIAQAQELDMPVMTTDRIFKRYDVRLVPV